MNAKSQQLIFLRMKLKPQKLKIILKKNLHWCCGFASICNKRTTQLLSHSFPLPSGMGRRIGRKKRQKLVGRDKNSLTEWQKEKKTSIILTKSIYNMQCSHHPMLSLLLSSKRPSLSQLPT